MASNDEDGTIRNGVVDNLVADIYPLSSCYFGSRDALPFKHEALSDRVQRMRSNYAANGLRTCVEAFIMVELFKHPYLLLLQVRNSIFKLPGGRLRPDESDIDGLKLKLASKLSVSEDLKGDDWEECMKLFLVKLPASRKFVVPKT